MSEEGEPGAGMLRRYVDWLFEGHVLVVAVKFLWTGMYLTAFTTFHFEEGLILVSAGVIVWFIANDYENWYIEWE